MLPVRRLSLQVAVYRTATAAASRGKAAASRGGVTRSASLFHAAVADLKDARAASARARAALDEPPGLFGYDSQPAFLAFSDDPGWADGLKMLNAGGISPLASPFHAAVYGQRLARQERALA